ncbi:hypothetical protein BH20ACT16_BH20ACT16_03890 [soil metagenome]
MLATAIVFAAAGGLVAFGLWPEPAPRGDEQQLVLPAAPAQPVSVSQPSTRARPAPTAQTPRATRLAGVRREIAGPLPAMVVPDATEPTTTAPHVPLRPEPVEAPPLVADAARPREPVAETVGETTTALAVTLRRVADALAHGLGAVAPGPQRP